MKPVWTSRYPNRFYNEDNQREYEEIAFQAMSAVLLQCNDKQKCATKDVCPELFFPSGRDDDDLSYTSKCTIFFHPANFSVIFISAGAREDGWEN